MNKPLKYGLFLFAAVAGIELVIFVIFELLTKNLGFFSLLKFTIFVLAILLSSFFVVFIVLNTVPYFRKFLIKERSLTRFQNLSHPLLLKLSLEAPGTYHHSLTVANLSYNAAKAIGADTILARIGGYYHDIGKLKDPLLFIENQDTAENGIIFENLPDIKNRAKQIIDHVHYGLLLGQEHSLPEEIAGFIAEHHGTTTTLYFVNAAQKINPKINTDIFTYPGPKPLSRETAIVMLADAIEATLRLVKNIDSDKIAQIVDEAINNRLNERQLDLAGLTQKDVEKIRDSFIKTLGTVHHQRINYRKN